MVILAGKAQWVSVQRATNPAHLPRLTSSLQMCLSVQEKTKINAPVLQEMWQNTENETAELREKAANVHSSSGGFVYVLQITAAILICSVVSAGVVWWLGLKQSAQCSSFHRNV